MRLKAVLFDLDNTLILFHELTFYNHYNRALYGYFRDIMTVEDFSHRLMNTTQQLLNNDGSISNLDHFMRSFAAGNNHTPEELLQRFTTFYEKEFEQFKPLMQPVPAVTTVISHIRRQGLKTVIATNPMFPTNVQQMRLDWAGLGDVDFDLITSVENSTYCKPRLEYYQEICTKIDVPPDQCLMVGNDAFNDMIASRIGMKTYLTTDSDEKSIELSRELAKGETADMPKPDFEGPLADLISIIDELI